MSFLQTSPEIVSCLGNVFVRQGLVDHSVTVYFIDWQRWHLDTEQTFIDHRLIHFVDPDGTIVGIKALSNPIKEKGSRYCANDFFDAGAVQIIPEPKE